MYNVVSSPSSPASGMGANLAAGGVCSFRIWAPNASAVQILLRPPGGGAYQALMLARDGNPEYWSADISGVSEGDEYRVHITNARDPARGNPGGEFEHVDSYARRVQSPDPGSPGYIVQPAFAFAPFAAPAPSDLLIYQMQVGSFRGKNDDIAPPGGVANFKDVIPRLQYIKDLNFNAIQLLPAGQYPPDQPEGYAPTNFFSPESDEGTPEDLRRLVDACHQAGLAVFFDVIYNHVPDVDNNLWQFDGNQSNSGGGIYFAPGRSLWGPQPATDRPPVHNFFLDNVRMWLREYNADGLRFDSLHNVVPEGGAWWLMTDIAGEFGGKTRIAEHDNPSWALGRYPLTAAWDMGSADNFRNVLANGSIQQLESLISYWGVPHAANLVRYLLGSHDQIFNRFHGADGACGFSRYFVERVGGVFIGRNDWSARAKARLGWALNVTMPGIPMLFMGLEVDHYGYWCPDIDIYGDHRFDWNLTRDAIGQQMRALVSAANRLRVQHGAMRTDTLLFTHRDPANGVIAFKRWNNFGDVILVVVNIGESQFSDATYGVSLGGDTGTWEEIFNSQSPQYGGWPDSGNYLAFPSVQGDGRIYIRLPKLGVLVFRKT